MCPIRGVEEQTQETELSVGINRLPIRAGLVRICLRCVLLGRDFNTDLYTFSVLILTRKTNQERLLGGGGSTNDELIKEFHQASLMNQ